MDRASFYDNKHVVDLFESNGHTILFLPQYTREYNKIEKKWAELKAYRRKFKSVSFRLVVAKLCCTVKSFIFILWIQFYNTVKIPISNIS